MPSERIPKLSVAMPVRNGQNYLRAAFESLLGQTFADFELIVSDNASTDGTEAIVRDFASRDPRIAYHRHEQNLGAAGNFNFGFERSRGRLFKWAAHDDVCEPEFLRRTIELLERSPDAVIAHSYTHEIDHAGRVIGKYDDQLALIADRPSARLGASFNIAYPSPVWGVMRREAVAKTRLMGSYLGSDWNFLGEMLLLGRLVIVPEYLFSVRNHEAGFSFGLQKQSKQARLSWFDPNRKHPILSAFTSARCFAAAAMHHPLPASERAACLRAIAGRFTRRVPAFVRRKLGLRAAGAG